VLVQEHTVERRKPAPGGTKSTLPQPAGMPELARRGGNDCCAHQDPGQRHQKLVPRCSPYYEAKGLSRWELAGKQVPPLVIQIADGENGGVMMNEFPAKYHEVIREGSGSETPILNGSEYLEHLAGRSIHENDLPTLQPIFQKRNLDRFRPGSGPEQLAKVIDDLKKEDSGFTTRAAVGPITFPG